MRPQVESLKAEGSGNRDSFTIVRGCLLRDSVYGLTSPRWPNGTFLIRYFGNRNGQITKLSLHTPNLYVFLYFVFVNLYYVLLPLCQHLLRVYCLYSDKKNKPGCRRQEVLFFCLLNNIFSKLQHSIFYYLFVSLIAGVSILSAVDLAVIFLFVILVSNLINRQSYYTVREKC